MVTERVPGSESPHSETLHCLAMLELPSVAVFSGSSFSVYDF